MEDPRDRLLRLWIQFSQIRSSFSSYCQSSESASSLQELREAAIKEFAEGASMAAARNRMCESLKELEDTSYKRALTMFIYDDHVNHLHPLFSNASGGVTDENTASNILRRIWVVMLRARSLPRIHTAPGWTLHRIADFCFSKATVESVLGPALLDLQYEYQEALSEGRIWKARWVRCRGYWSFWSAVVAQLPVSVVKRIYELWRAAG